MKIILLKDVDKIGKAGDVKTVKDGFARNFLFPKKMAELATPSALKIWEKRREQIKKLEEQKRTELQNLADKIKSISLTVYLKSGENQEAFGSATVKDIMDALMEQGIIVEKSAIILEKPIKTFGEHIVPVDLGCEIKTELKISVEPE